MLLSFASLINLLTGYVTGDQQILSPGYVSLHACYDLASIYPKQTISSSDPQYPASQSEYWSKQQSELKPTCRFLPSNSEDVRSALEILYTHNTSFAVSSGGHSSNIGFSNIDSGVTIDLSSLNYVHFTQGDEGVWIGPGARWGEVYRTLEPERLTVAGGRLSHVGVGGLVLGGGISWFANQEGWSCDSVLGFEIVTPDLQVRYVHRDSLPDLFWALKGSAGSFGVVTGIRMRTIEATPLTGIYAGAIAFNEEHLPEALSVLAKTAAEAQHDEFTSSYLSFGYLPADKEFVYNAYIVNTEGKDDTSSLKAWNSIPNLFSSLRHSTIVESADEISTSNPMGLRRSKFTFTTSVQLEKVTPLQTLFRNFALRLNLDDNGLLGMNFQPLTVPMMNASALSADPNIFSETLGQDMIPLLVVSIELWWSDSKRDAEYDGLMRDLEKEMLGPNGVDWAKHSWVYPNYAAAWQEPFTGWRLGEKTVEKLKEVKRLYDPQGMWKNLRPGVWQI